jgi:dCMP deaminase
MLKHSKDIEAALLAALRELRRSGATAELLRSSLGTGLFKLDVDRPSWDNYFLSIATTVALRSDCTRSLVGAVVVDKNHRIRSTGYVGVAPGVTGCLEGACPRGRMTYQEFPSVEDYSNCISTHAERNALLYCDPEDRAGTTMYVTRKPCVFCKQLLFAEKVSKIVWYDSLQRICSEPLSG